MSHISVPCATCHACCKAPWFVKLMPWERERYGADEVPKKENGDCVHLGEAGCLLFGKPERPYVCRTFDCRNKLREWNARGRPELSPGLGPVIWAALKLGSNETIGVV